MTEEKQTVRGILIELESNNKVSLGHFGILKRRVKSYGTLGTFVGFYPSLVNSAT